MRRMNKARPQAALDETDRIKLLEEKLSLARAQEQLEEVTERILSDAKERAKSGVMESNGHTSEDLRELTKTNPGDVEAYKAESNQVRSAFAQFGRKLMERLRQRARVWRAGRAPQRLPSA